MNGDPKHKDKNKKYFGGACPLGTSAGTGRRAPSSPRSILYNHRSEGKIPYGRHRKAYKKGTKVRVEQAEYMLVCAEHFRIVGKKLVQAVRKRQQQTAKTYIRNSDGSWWGRPGTGRDSRYLLTGMLRCSCCGGNIAMVEAAMDHPGNGPIEEWRPGEDSNLRPSA